MKRLLSGVAVALLAVVGSTAAGEVVEWGPLAGSVVHWDRIEGTVVMPDGSGMRVGPLEGSARYRVGGSGSVTLFLGSGLLNIRVQGLSWGLHYPNGPLGQGLKGTFMGTVVCDSTERFAAATWVDTPEFELNQGLGTFVGMIAMPQECRDRPEEIVFLLRHAGSSPQYGLFVAYGAGRVIR